MSKLFDKLKEADRVRAGMQRDRIETERSAGQAAQAKLGEEKRGLDLARERRRRKSSCGASPMRAPRPGEGGAVWSPSASAPKRRRPPRRSSREEAEKRPRRWPRAAARRRKKPRSTRASEPSRRSRRPRRCASARRPRNWRGARRASVCRRAAGARRDKRAQGGRGQAQARGRARTAAEAEAGRLAKERGDIERTHSSSSKRGAMPRSGPGNWPTSAAGWNGCRAARAFAR